MEQWVNPGGFLWEGEALPSGTFLGFPPSLTSPQPKTHPSAVRPSALLRSRCSRCHPLGTSPAGNVTRLFQPALATKMCHNDCASTKASSGDSFAPNRHRAIILMYRVFRRDKEETLLCLSVSERLIHQEEGALTQSDKGKAFVCSLLFHFQSSYS